jgi:hypothetical protein
MSRIQGVLKLAASPDRARIGGRKAFAELGWAILRDSAHEVEAREDMTRLCCHQSPAETTLRIEGCDEGCNVTIETKVPGFGPVSAQHARERQGAVVRHVHAQTIGSADGLPIQADGWPQPPIGTS